MAATKKHLQIFISGYQHSVSLLKYVTEPMCLHGTRAPSPSPRPLHPFINPWPSRSRRHGWKAQSGRVQGFRGTKLITGVRLVCAISRLAATRVKYSARLARISRRGVDLLSLHKMKLPAARRFSSVPSIHRSLNHPPFSRAAVRFRSQDYPVCCQRLTPTIHSLLFNNIKLNTS